MESIISGCGKFNRSKDKDLIEARYALVQAWKDDVERAFEKVDKNLPDMMARHIADICYRESEQLKKQITMERKIGEIFEYKGEWYQCVEQSACALCAFNETDCNDIDIGDCASYKRSDGKPVIFKKLEKVGEPYVVHDHSRNEDVTVQDYKLYEIRGARYTGPDTLDFCPHGKIEEIVAIEIKQTKEDMEEKKLNLKLFDIQKAREGKPVCTRDGRKARIICFDRKSETPITVLVTEINGIEAVYSYPNNGIWDSPENTNGCDLMMLPEKKEMWINIYRGVIRLVPGAHLYDTEEEAKDAVKGDENYVITTKVCWEE